MAATSKDIALMADARRHQPKSPIDEAMRDTRQKKVETSRHNSARAKKLQKKYHFPD